MNDSISLIIITLRGELLMFSSYKDVYLIDVNCVSNTVANRCFQISPEIIDKSSIKNVGSFTLQLTIFLLLSFTSVDV